MVGEYYTPDWIVYYDLAPSRSTVFSLDKVIRI